MSERKDELYALTLDFLDAFNRNDLDAVMAFFTPDAVYDELNGVRSVGLTAIRSAWVVAALMPTPCKDVPARYKPGCLVRAASIA